MQPYVSYHLPEMPTGRAACDFRLSEKRIDDVYDSLASANNMAGRETDFVFAAKLFAECLIDPEIL